MDKNYVLKVENLKTKFIVGKRIVNAVNGVSFSLKRGKTLGIVGESGCGKSATAHSILQLLPKMGFIESGTVDYCYTDGSVKRLSDFRRNSKDMRKVRGKDIAMVFQDPMSSLNPVYSIGSQIEENLLIHEKIKRKDAKKRVLNILTELGIPEAEKRYHDYPHQFSGGMKQRVMIAIAMICKPDVLIADEPTTALDVTIQAQILALMKKLQEDNDTSIILITHNMGIIADMCDDVGVMYMGKLVEFGTLKQVFTNPLHPYTKALMKSVPIPGMSRETELESINGNTPDGSTIFSGCEFVERCHCAMQKCSSVFPEETTDTEDHHVRCHLYGGKKDE